MEKTTLIAGGTSGIGLETVKQLAEQEGRLVCACRSPDQLPDLPGVEGTPFDATAPHPRLQLPDRLDGFVYFPGTITLKPFHRLSDEDFLGDLEVNLLGAVRLLRQALPALKRSESASVVLFSTVAVQTGFSFHASIAAAKGAVEGLTRSLAAEFAPKIRVNCIAPSLTDTPLASTLLGSEAKRNASADHHPLKRLGDAAETARLVGFLLSEASGFMTGQILGLNGGLSSIKSF